ncbi:MAG: diacylglycerol kinase family protein [Pirellulales bacterium]
MRSCVIFNPIAGRRRSRRRLARFRERWNARAEFWPTEYRGHATELARMACEQGFTTVVAAGGDGTAHEVANGILSAAVDQVTLAVVPIGSANDYAYSLARQFGVSRLDDESHAKVDIGFATTPGGFETYFVESLGLGLSAQVTLESQRISRLQGKALYALAAYRAVRSYRSSELTVQYDDEPPWTARTLMLSAMIGNREGSFLLAPHAELDDGQFDVVSAGVMGRWRVLGMLPRLALFGLPARHPQIALRRCRTLQVHSAAPLAAHTDGEMFCTPAEGIQDLTIRLLPARLRVKVCRP